MPRFAVDDAPAVQIAAVAKGEPIKTVLVINRGPDSVFIAFDGDAPAVAAAAVEMKVDDFLTRKMGRGQVISAICAAGKVASVHVLSDPEE